MDERVDPRLLQANERTLLAWTRTGIALMTFGFVIARIGVWLRTLSPPADGEGVKQVGTAWIGAVFVALGALGNAVSTWRYVRTKQAIRSGKDIPEGAFPASFALVVTILGALLGAYLVRKLV